MNLWSRVLCAVAVGLLASSKPALAERPVGAAATQPDDGRTVVIRCSEAWLDRLVSAEILDEEPVDRVVLGTPVVGNAWIKGRLSLDLRDDEGCVSVFVVFEGTATTRTMGRNRSAVIHSTGTTNFKAVKPIKFELGKGFFDQDAQVTANTTLRTDSIDSTRRRPLRGLVRRIAARRVDENRATVEAIAEESARARIAASFDKATDELLSRMNARLDTVRPTFVLYNPRRAASMVHLCTTDQHLQICIGPNAGDPGIASRLPTADVDDKMNQSQIQVWFPTSVLDEHLHEHPAWQQSLCDVFHELGQRRESLGVTFEHPKSPTLWLAATGPWAVIGLETQPR